MKKIKFELNNAKYNNKIENEDYVRCGICGLFGENLQFHITIKHKISISFYKEKYNLTHLCKKQINRLSESATGEKNIWYNHKGKYSIFSKNSLDFSSEKSQTALEKMIKTKKENPHKNPTTIEYYINKGMTIENAIIARKERQQTFTLNKCIEKFGKIEGKERWLKRQEKWQKSYKKSNFSKIAQNLFWSIINDGKFSDLGHIHFAQLSETKEKDISGKNYEYVLKLDRVVKPDFIDVKNKKIIEFNGSYWHGNVGRGNKTKDEIRNNMLRKNGYRLLEIEENDYRKNKTETVQKCINFLIQ
jgi:hypothetical protein